MSVVLLASVSACTYPRWIVQDTQKLDPDDYREVDSRQFPSAVGNITPENPLLRLQVYSEATYNYAEKVQVARYVQDYKVRPVFLALGLL
ncbi:MAG: hypothetical protein R3224_06405, partial [Balneolaceae bacterium]|nr:hypothetical protein [Balneolaceae bacterium]